MQAGCGCHARLMRVTHRAWGGRHAVMDSCGGWQPYRQYGLLQKHWRARLRRCWQTMQNVKHRWPGGRPYAVGWAPRGPNQKPRGPRCCGDGWPAARLNAEDCSPRRGWRPPRGLIARCGPADQWEWQRRGAPRACLPSCDGLAGQRARHRRHRRMQRLHCGEHSQTARCECLGQLPRAGGRSPSAAAPGGRQQAQPMARSVPRRRGLPHALLA